MDNSVLGRNNLTNDPSRSTHENTQAKKPSRESERWLLSVVQNTSDVVTVVDADGTVRYVSPSIEQMLGHQPKERIGRSCFELLHPEDLPQARSTFAEALRRPGDTLALEVRMRNRDDSWRHVEVTGTNLLDDPSIRGIVINWRDVTDHKRAEEDLRKSEARLAEAQRIAHLGNWEWDIRTGEVWWSDETYRICGFEPGQFVPTLETVVEVFHRDDRHLLRALIDDAFHEDEPDAIERRIVRPDGEVRWVHHQYEVVYGEGGEPVRLVGTVHDITERKTLEERLEHQAFHDPLTDLPNRRMFMDRLEHALMRTKRRRRGRKVAVLFMDLDGFKVVNDSLGHEVGDRLLVAVSERLRGCLRPEDTLARFGGDEFTVLIEDVKEPVDAAKVAERILEVLNEHFVLEGRELFVNASIGIAFGGEAYTKLSEELLRHADAAMYRAKEDRVVRYEIFEPSMYEQVLGRLELENSLRRALENEELRIHYQPQFRSGQPNNRISGIEALMRWEHPQRGLMPPEEFIPIAEETGLILPLGRWILREACRQAKEWQGRYPSEPPLSVCVNVSAEQIRHLGLAREVSLALRESELEPGSLVLELTEGTLLKDTQISEAVLGELKALGVRLAIDDFGKEYSSLSYLKRLPVDLLKLDRSFVEDLGEDQKNMTIAEMMILLTHSLGLEVIGEGVQSAKQLEYLREMGCDLVQGYHLARPLPSEKVELMLAASLRRLP